MTILARVLSLSMSLSSRWCRLSWSVRAIGIAQSDVECDRFKSTARQRAVDVIANRRPVLQLVEPAGALDFESEEVSEVCCLRFDHICGCSGLVIATADVYVFVVRVPGPSR